MQYKPLRVIAVLIAVYIVGSVATELFRTARLYYSINQATTINQQLQEDTARLNNEVLRLQDEEYIQTFVSGTIFQTQEGTSIYILPERNNAQD